MAGTQTTARSLLTAVDTALSGLRWPWIAAAAIYCGTALVIFRLDFGAAAGSLPQGTNALNAYTFYQFQVHHPFTVWLSPYTDWGQPSPSYPGLDPQNLIASSGAVPATLYLRGLEFVSFVTAGLTVCLLVLHFGGSKASAIVGGYFYLLMAEVPAFFEGHIPGMLSLALGPLMILLVMKFFEAPSLRLGSGLALTLFIMTSMGDLGFLYRFLFFGSLIAIIQIGHRLLTRVYTRPELTDVGLSGLLLILLLLPWLVSELAGVRPQLTTGIVTTIVPFGNTYGNSLYLAFTGFAGDNSYTLFYLHSFTYALDYSVLGPLFWLIPAGVGAYAVLLGSRRELLFYAGGLLAMFLSTGATYSSLNVLNATLYNHVPFLDTDAELVHWSYYYILVVATLLGPAITRVETWIAEFTAVRPSATASLNRYARRTLNSTSSDSAYVTSTPPRSRFLPSRRYLHAALIIALLLIVASIPTVQNWEAFDKPPTTFEFPSSFTVGYSYVGTEPAIGGVFSVPFGNIYERTPWGGVSASSQLEAGLSTDRNLAIFEAGTPASLELDTVLGDGLADGYSNNLTKLLNATGIQYVVSTSYPDWSYASDSIYNPIESLLGLGQQVGLGDPVFSEGYQQVYHIVEPAGNVSVYSTYYVYSGAQSLVYEILNEPWYSSSDALLCMCDVPPQDTATVLNHSAGLISSPSGLASLTPAAWSAVSSARVPLLVLVGASDFQPGSITAYRMPWNASNGVAFGSPNATTNATLNGVFPILAAHGFIQTNVSIRSSAPPGAGVTVGTGGSQEITRAAGPPIVPIRQLDYWNASTTFAGINNHGAYPYNGSVDFVAHNGTDYLDWHFAPFNDTFQYLDFNLHNLSGLTGLSITVQGQIRQPSQLTLQIVFDNGSASVPSYPYYSGGSLDSTSYAFYFPLATGAGAPVLRQNLSNVSRFVFGFPKTGSQDELALSNLSGFANESGGFQQRQIGTLPFNGTSSLNVLSTPLVNIDTISLAVVEPLSPGGPRVDIYSPQPVITDERLSPGLTGWRLVQLAQAYSPLWELDGAVGEPIHVLTDLGLNGWLVNLSSDSNVHIVYRGAGVAYTSSVVEGVGLSAWLLGIPLYSRWRRRNG